jgi:hypothetical protein
VAAAEAVVAAAEAAGKQLKDAGRSRLRLAALAAQPSREHGGLLGPWARQFFVFARDRGMRSWHRWRVTSNRKVIKGRFDQPMIRRRARA